MNPYPYEIVLRTIRLITKTNILCDMSHKQFIDTILLSKAEYILELDAKRAFDLWTSREEQLYPSSAEDPHHNESREKNLTALSLSQQKPTLSIWWNTKPIFPRRLNEQYWF